MRPSGLVFLGVRRQKAPVSRLTFNQTLERLVHVLTVTEDPWWILGSAAMYLKGYDPGHIGDIDVLLSEADAQRVMSVQALNNDSDGGTPRYRSTYVLRPHLGKVPVELLAGYEIFQNPDWYPVWPLSRIALTYRNNEIFVPSDKELISIFERLGRTKDFDRIRAIQAR